MMPFCPPKIKDLDNEALHFAGGKMHERVFRFFSMDTDFFRGSTLQGLLSKSKTMNWLTNSVFEHKFVTKGNKKGIATPDSIETRISIDEARRLQTFDRVRAVFAKHHGMDNPNAFFRDERALAQSLKDKSKLNFSRFSEEVDIAMRRGDVHKVKEVQEAAKILRKEMDESINGLVRIGAMPPGLTPKGALSYLTRRYNREMLVTAEGERRFKEMLNRNFMRSQPDESVRLSKINETYKNVLGLGDEGMEMEDFVKNFLKGGDNAKFLKERVLEIPDEELAPFLKSDVIQTVHGFTRQASAMVRTAEKLKEMDVKNIPELKKMVRDDHLARRTGVTDDKVLARIDKEMLEDIKRTDDFFKILHGQFGDEGFEKLRHFRKWNVATMLGGVLLSSIPDASMHIFVNGMKATFQDGLPRTGKLIKATRGINENLNDMDFAMKQAANTVLQARFDPDGRVGKVFNTPADKALDTMLGVFSKATGINQWNVMMSRIGARTQIGQLMRKMESHNAGKLTQADKDMLARMGIGEAQYPIIKRNLKFVEEIDGAKVADLGRFDEEAKGLISSMIHRGDIILKPGKGQIPAAFQKNEIMKTIFQFKSFISAAHNDIMLSSIQQFEKDQMMGLVSLTIMGALSMIIKDKIAGRDTDMSPEHLVLQGVVRSGVAGLTGEVAGLFSPVQTSRYAGMNAQGFFGGPTFTQMVKAFESFSKLTDGEVTKEDALSLKKFVPFQNIFYKNLLMNQIGN